MLSLKYVGREESFFELGGDSLDATRIMSRLRTVFQLDLPLGMLYFHPTVRGLTEAIQQTLSEDTTPLRPTLVPRARFGEVPLSFSQERLWLLDQVTPGNPSYIESLALRLEGALNNDTLEQSVLGLLRRHEALRTTFPSVDGRPHQVVAPELSVPLDFVDLSRLSTASRKREALRIAADKGEEPFDLEFGPLFRTTLMKLGDRTHVLLLFTHHIVADGWSLGVIAGELGELYGSAVGGRSAALPTLPVQYVDYALWQRTLSEEGELHRQLEYWRSQLADLSPLELPTDHARPPLQTFGGARYRFEVDADLCARLRRLGQGEGATLFMTLLAVFQTLLARYSDQADIAVGSPVAGRNHPELESLVGFFVNPLVFRGDLTGDPTFRTLLGRTREAAVAAFMNQDLPFSRLVQELQPERDLSRSPLFQTMFIFQNAPLVEPAFPDMDVSFFEVPRRHAEFDLTLIIWEHGQELAVDLEYDTTLFDQPTVERMAGHFCQLLRSVAADPDTRLSDLDLLTPRERRQMLFEWNETDAPFPEDQCLHELIEAQVRRTPEEGAIAYRGKRISYRELNARANRLARVLRSLGVGPEVVVGVCLERSPELVVSLLAVLKAGGAYLPLDPAYPKERLGFMLADSGASVVLAHERFVGRLPTEGVCLVLLDREERFEHESTDDLSSRTRPDNLAYVIYTSGSTGTPNGVQVTHRSLVNLLTAMAAQLGVTSEDVLLALTSISFDIAGMELYLPLTVGAKVVLPPMEAVSDGPGLVELVQASDVTFVQATPATWRMLLEAGSPLPGGVRIACGGENLPLGLARGLHEWTNSVWNLYGPTETTIWSTVARIDRNVDVITIGRPIANTLVYLLDPALNPVPVGVPGELCIGGAGLARGYLGRPALTAERFVPNPFSAVPGERLYRTGDLARYLADGRIESLGRGDQQVKVRGFRIELGEVEASLLEHPAVREAVVMAREDGSSGKHLVAYVVAPESVPNATELRSFLKDRLPEYMLPAAYVTLPALPLTPNGKLDRRALPPPEGARPELGARFRPPRDEREQLLAAIWAEVLRLDHIGLDDNFFELGGDSILGILVIARARKNGLQLTAKQLFQHQTVASLAASAGMAAPTDVADAAKPGSVTSRPWLAEFNVLKALGLPLEDVVDIYPLAPLQQSILAQVLEAPGAGLYVVPSEAVLEGPIHPETLRRACQMLLDRHAALRTSFVWEGVRRPVQIVRARAEFPFTYHDLSDQAPAAQWERRRSFLGTEWAQGFDLTRVPLTRMALTRLAADRHSLVWSRHNAILDGWSFARLFRELFEIYAELVAGRTPAVHVPQPYRDYISWLGRRDFSAAEAFWRGYMADFAGATSLPLPPPATADHTGVASHEEFTFALPPAATARLQELVRLHRLTLSTLLQGAWALLLHRYTGAEDVVFGVTLSTRPPELAGIESMIGLLVNMLPVRARIQQDRPVAAWLHEMHAEMTNLRQFDHVSLETVQRLTSPPSEGPPFETLLLFQNYPLGFSDGELGGGLRLVETVGFSRIPYPLTISVDPGEVLRVALLFDRRRFDRVAIEAVAKDFRQLLEALGADPERRLADLVQGGDGG